MGLFGSLNVGKNAILTNQRALDVIGNNIANADNPAYSRQRIELETLQPNRQADFFVGNGVQVGTIRRIFDQQVENRLKTATSTLGSLERQSDAYQQLERVINALGDDLDNGQFVTLGGQIDQFFNELHALSSDPSSASLRQIFLARADSLSATFRTMADETLDLRASLNESVKAAVDRVNQLTTNIAQYNHEIVRAEVGGTTLGVANDLRDQRDFYIRELAALTDIQTVEQKTGAIDVRVGGQLLVSGNDAFKLELRTEPDNGIDIVMPEFAMSGSDFNPRAGELGGLLIARDDILTSFMGDLDEMARTVMQTFNEVHTTGRGLVGLKSVASQAFTATHALKSQLPMSIEGTVQQSNALGTFLVDPSLRAFPNGLGDNEYFVGAKVLFTSGNNEGRSSTITRYDPGTGRLELDPPIPGGIGLGDSFEITSFDYPIENGSFKLNVRNDVTGVTDVFDIQVDRDGLPTPPNLDDTSLQDLVSDINTQLSAFYGGSAPVIARINDQYQLEIVSRDADISFHFTEDTSGFLAAAGLNTFFAGKGARDMRVADAVVKDSRLLATGTSAAPGDNSNVQRLIALQSAKLFNGGTSTVGEFYRGVVGTIGVETATAKELAKNQQLIADAAQNARDRISAVNIDEEAIDLIRYQRSFQAASRYLGVVDSLMQELMQII